jgi:hypothetical protein
VSWGSRSTGDDNAMKAAAVKTDENYKNYRSNFLVFWLILNLITGVGISELAKNGQNEIIFYIGASLSGVLASKLLFSLLHYFSSFYHVFQTSRYIKSRKSSIFKGIEEKPSFVDSMNLFDCYRGTNVHEISLYDACRDSFILQ